MYINQLMNEQDMTYEELCMKSGIAGSTIRDILDGTSYIPNCKASTLYDIASALNTTVEDILENSWDEEDDEYKDENPTFELTPDPPEAFYLAQYDILKMLHETKDDVVFINSLRKSGAIHELIEHGSTTMALYLVALIDYLSRINNRPLPEEYAFTHDYRLSEPVYPISVMKSVNDPVRMKKQIEELENKSIPEFARFNIWETAEHIRE